MSGYSLCTIRGNCIILERYIIGYLPIAILLDITLTWEKKKSHTLINMDTKLFQYLGNI